MDTLRRCCPGGHYIPSITYGLPGAVYPHVDAHIDRAVADYNAQLHVPHFPLPPVPRRVRTAAVRDTASAAVSEQGGVLSRLAAAMEKGQQKKVLALCRQAVEQGREDIPAKVICQDGSVHDLLLHVKGLTADEKEILLRGIAPQSILSDGLIRGMNDLGEAFSASRAFVPEMLMAARCMTAALAELKPLMTGPGTETVGRACIGTVRGDMHDIGKNLVKIMLEGSGVEVVDLGVDVTPEQFVETAKTQSCGIIACSSLLTTTMDEMRRVVSLAREAGIRDRVKIFVGGAPISQSFCDEIGADVYTEDAAAAARAAVSALKH